ncbi:MAG: hypothetical protein V2A73_17055 [Pseudomonadota bacterium]
MRIIVFLRRLCGPPELVGSERVIGRCDEASLHVALELRAGLSAASAATSAATSATVTAIAVGSAAQEGKALEYALQLGVDRAICVDEPKLATIDYRGVGRILATVARQTGYDMVLAGDRSEDESLGATGATIAEWLGIPHLTGIRDLEIAAEADAVSAPQAKGAQPVSIVLATRWEQGTVRTVRVPLPAVLAIASSSSLASPVRKEHEPSSRAEKKTERIVLQQLGLNADELGQRSSFLGRLCPLRAGRKVVFLANGSDLVARLHDDRLLA